MISGLPSWLHTARDVLRVTSAGDKGFSAGMDASQFKHTNASLAHVTITRLGQVCEAV